MDSRHLAPYVKRLVAASRALELAVAADDLDLIVESHAAVGRVRERLGPAISSAVKQAAMRESRDDAARTARIERMSEEIRRAIEDPGPSATVRPIR